MYIIIFKFALLFFLLNRDSDKVIELKVKSCFVLKKEMYDLYFKKLPLRM